MGKINGSLFGDWSSSCQSLCFSFWLALGSAIGGGIVTVVGVHPTHTSPHGVVPVGLGDGVGDCHDAAILQRAGLFIFPLVFSGGENYGLCSGVCFNWCVLLSMLVALSGSLHLVTMMHIRWVPPSGQVWGNTGRKTVRPHFLPWLDVFFLVNKPDHFLFWGAGDMDAPRREGLDILVLVGGISPLISCPLSLSMLVAGERMGDFSGCR